MNNRISALIIALTIGMSVMAQGTNVTLDRILLVMPDSLMPLLSVSDRQDFLDYRESGMVGRATNRLGGESTMTYSSDRRLTISTSGSGQMHMSLLERRGGGHLVCVVNTVTAGGFRDSRIGFYDVGWNHFPVQSFIKLPVFDDFLKKEYLKSDSVAMLRRQTVLEMYEITLTDDGLEIALTSQDYLGEEAPKFARFYRESPLRYRWNGWRFVPVK